MGAYLVFIDESGFLLIPPVRKTWAPRGQTPVHRHRYRHDRVSLISGVSVSPKRQRLGLYYAVHPHNIRHAQVCEFLRHLLRHLRAPLIVLWDNGRIHRGEPIRDLCRQLPRLHLEAFPAYAPELNPDEGVWTHLKRDLSNSRPDDQNELSDAVIDVLEDLTRSQSRLRGCIRQSDLPPFLV